MAKDEREVLCEAGASFFARGYAFGSTGNLSIREDDKVWITPTGESLRSLTIHNLACIDFEGAPQNRNRPSKEFPFHLAAYRSAGEARALVHLHCTYSVALSCLAGLDEEDPLPVVTPYYLMRVAPLAVLPYHRPGSEELAQAIGQAAEKHSCLLLRNHGIVCLGRTMSEAVDKAEELEETARLRFLLRGESLQALTVDQRTEIARVFNSK